MPGWADKSIGASSANGCPPPVGCASLALRHALRGLEKESKDTTSAASGTVDPCFLFCLFCFSMTFLVVPGHHRAMTLKRNPGSVALLCLLICTQAFPLTAAIDIPLEGKLAADGPSWNQTWLFYLMCEVLGLQEWRAKVTLLLTRNCVDGLLLWLMLVVKYANLSLLFQGSCS